MKNIYKFIAVFIMLIFLGVIILPAEVLAYRSRDGGADVTEFDTGGFLGQTAISIAGGMIGSEIRAGDNPFNDSFGSSIAGVGNGFATYEINRGINMMGSYNDWPRTKTLMMSSIATGAVGGMLGSDLDNMGEGFAKGALSGAIDAGVRISLEGDRINNYEKVTAGTAALGDMLSSVFTGSDFSSALGSGMTTLITNDMSDEWRALARPIISSSFSSAFSDDARGGSAGRGYTSGSDVTTGTRTTTGTRGWQSGSDLPTEMPRGVSNYGLAD